MDWQASRLYEHLSATDIGLQDAGIQDECSQNKSSNCKQKQVVTIQTEIQCYSCDRGSNFGSLPDPAYIPAADPQEGWFEYLGELNPEMTFGIIQGPILGIVPELVDDPDLTAANIGGFTHAADDTRAVIEYMHTWPAPGDFATPVPWDVGGDTFYDVSISDVSGLQVPKRMVAGTEGRENTVTLANAGPADAFGTVTLVGIDAGGNQVFALSEDFELLAGYSQSWVFFFSMNEATTITWSATADAEYDVNLSNDSVTEITIVGGAKGGGGH